MPMLNAEQSAITLDELLEQAAAEKDPQRFRELLRQIGARLSARNTKIRPLKTVPDPPSSMEGDTFDLFAGLPNRSAVWKESVTGIERARQRMQEMATAAPGDYFIFHERSHAILAKASRGPAPASEAAPLPPMIIRPAS